MTRTDTRLVLEMVYALIQCPDCFWVETDGLALAVGSPHPDQILSMIDTNNGTVLHFPVTPTQFAHELHTKLHA